MLRDKWSSLGKVGQWVTGIASSVATLIAAYFAVAGFTETMDGWVVTEAEAAEQLQQQLEVFEEYRKGLEDERTNREIADLQIDIERINLQIRYLNNIEDPDADEELELETLREWRDEMRKRLRYLRCVESGRPVDECNV
jgi:hypothetical protein